MFLQPVKIFTSSRCIYDKQKFFVVDPVNDQIINDSTMFVKEESVLASADIELVDVVCEYLVEPCARAGSVNNQLSHMRNVEDANIISHDLMFLDDACVLNRHEPACERDHLRAELHVRFVQRRFFLCGFAHAPN